MLFTKSVQELKFGAMARSPGGLLVPAHARGRWLLRASDRNGKILWEDFIDNLVTTEGKNYLLDTGIASPSSPQTPIADWFIGLTDGTPTAAAGDTLASHAGWVEVTAFTGNRKLYTPVAASAGSITNAAALASFAIDADSTTIGGAFLASVDTGTGGTLYAIGASTGGDVVLNNGSTLEVTAVFSL
ncbi:MAG TPA: hypothetical protein VGA88_08340 [Burkholderiales bacterium]|jgi:hypothetical protein